jgi:serine/threonine protein kinase
MMRPPLAPGNEAPNPEQDSSATLSAANAEPGLALSTSSSSAELPPLAGAFLDQLLHLQLLTPGAAEQFLQENAPLLFEFTSPETLGRALVQSNRLTSYQLDRILAGTIHGLILGNYRVLDRLGAGAMGVVFLAEHALMKRRVAVKVLPVDDDCPDVVWERFCSEMKILADLHHDNIVLAFDAGHVAPSGPKMPDLLYLVMELVTGGDLEEYVIKHGPVDPAQACGWICQAACGLQEAHDHHLIHRDIKPSNLLLTDRRQVKIMDFGLAKQFSSRMTTPRALLGTLDYMAPEQSSDPSAVSALADIYGLGATLFWLLTGEPPYPEARSAGESMRMLQRIPPRRVRALRPEIPEQLDALIDCMLERDPLRRPSTPLLVMNALLPFTKAGEHIDLSGRSAQAPAGSSRPARFAVLAQQRVLIVDDESSVRSLARSILEPLGCVCEEAADAAQAYAAFAKESYDVLLLDLDLPDEYGYEVCRRLRERPTQPNLKIIIVSGQGDHNCLAEALPRGADDYISEAIRGQGASSQGGTCPPAQEGPGPGRCFGEATRHDQPATAKQFDRTDQRCAPGSKRLAFCHGQDG